VSLFNFIPNSSLDAEVARSETVADAALKAAEEIAKAAQASAPVQSGAYQGSIIAEAFKGGARVYASDEKSALIEFGAPGRGQPAKFNLRNAAVKLGYKFGKKGD
jgi:hypothetical protein